MIFRVFVYLLILTSFISCTTASKTAEMRNIAENNKDVVALSYLIRDYMLSTDNPEFTLEDIIKKDSLGRIAKNFSSIEIGYWTNLWRGGYVVYFKFAEGRNQGSVELTEGERIPWKVKEKKKIGRNDAQLAKKFDGEIHFHYQERFYHIAGIVVKTPAQ